MVALADLRQQPSSDNPFVAGLLGELSYQQGYVVSAVLQAAAGDIGSYGGAHWAMTGAKDAFIQAAAAWSAVANVTINVLPNNYQGTGNRSSYSWVEELADLGVTVLGEHNLPQAGDLGGAFNDRYDGFTPAGNQKGGFSFVTFLHEIGHGLGLTHPFDGPATLPGVTSEDSPGDYSLNSLATTVMSYNDYIVELHSPNPEEDPRNVAPSNFESPSGDFGWVATPMAFDIAAVQLLYGANMSTNAGDNFYYLATVNVAGTYWQCIWDAGGIDTISAANAATYATIDLRPASLLDEPGGGGWLSHVNGIYGGFTIAHGVIIENAIGSAYGDIITGNDAANNMIGGAGDDQIWGGDGDDIIDSGEGTDAAWGGNGADRLTASAGFNQLYGQAGNDHISGGIDDDWLYGGDGDDVLEGGAGNDDLWGEAGADTLSGGAGDDMLDGGTGDDTMAGGGGNDVYFLDSAGDLVIELADEGHDTVHAPFDYVLPGNVEDVFLSGTAAAATGNDRDNLILAGLHAVIIHGGLGNDTLIGSFEADDLQGDGGNDTVHGGAGADVIDGGDGDDFLYGDAGVDELYGGDGNDRLHGGGAGYDPYAGASVPFSGAQPPEGEADFISGGAGDDTIYLDGALAPSATLNDGFNLTLAYYRSHGIIDGGSGTDTLLVSTQVEFQGTLSSIERFYFYLPRDFEILPQLRNLGPPGILILKGDQVDVIEAGSRFSGKGTVKLELGTSAGFDGSTWLFDPDAEIAIRVTGGTGENLITGTAQADEIDGGAGNDTLTGGAGDDMLLGGDGQDLAVFSGNRADYRITSESAGYRVADQRAGANDGSDYVEGVEQFQFADGIFFVGGLPARQDSPVSDFRLFGSDGFVGEIGGSGQVFGTTGFQDITVLDSAGTISFDPSFNKGGDIIRLSGNAGDWQIVQSGSAAVFSDGDTYVQLPIGTAGTSVVFDDGVRSLRFDAGAGSLKIGAQSFGTEQVQVTAPADGLPLPTGADTEATARLFLGTDKSASAGGNLAVFGTSGTEQLTFTGGELTLDPSFNKGGDALILGDQAPDFLASRSGSTVLLDGATTDVVIPVGIAGMTIAFAGDDDRTLLFDAMVNNPVIGTQEIEATPTALIAFG